MLGIRPDNKRRKGFALIYVTMMGAFVLIPMAGLAVDFGMLYNVKARLQTAVDAASIGAGYMLHATTNLSDPVQLAAIQNAAERYFNANYPTHYFGSTIVSYSAVPASSISGKTITVNATATVPMLLMRVLRISQSTVGAMAVSNVRYISMMIVVDRSGSVFREGAGPTIQTALSTFVATASTSYLVDGVDTVGMVSFGGTWRLDFNPTITFQSGTPNIQTAINNIPFDTGSSTNTAEGLYQAWAQLYKMNLPGSLNVIVLLTDGRPSAFTSNFTPTTNCTSRVTRGGVLEAYVGLGWPPPTSGSDISGLFATIYQGTEANYLAQPSGGCHYNSNNLNVADDFSTSSFPNSVGPVDNVGASWVPTYTTPGTGLATQSGYYPGPGTSMTNPQSVRYAAFNAADNMATKIRQDTTLAPMLFVIGLNYSNPSEEALDEDWLARVANDPNYVTVGSDTSIVPAGRSVYQSTQTPGMYCNSTMSTLQTCFAQVTSQLLRLIR